MRINIKRLDFYIIQTVYIDMLIFKNHIMAKDKVNCCCLGNNINTFTSIIVVEQNDNVKLSIVDLRVKFETYTNTIPKTLAYCLMLNKTKLLLIIRLTAMFKNYN